jgi:ADP-heptose:LPS heptosyltransferase
LDHAPIDEQRLDPVAGMTTSNRKWQVIFSDGPMDIYRIHHLARYYVAYNHVNIFSPEEREALLHFAHDDSGKLWLNGILVAAAPYTSREDERNVPVHLKKGRNRLLYKIEQKEGGCFFAARITDRSGRPFQDLICTTENYVPRVPPAIGQALAVPENAIRDERVENERIRFRTDAVGFPHIIKISYFPNWKIRGAERIDIVSPAFMLVYPTQSEVELYYGRTKGDLLGLGLATAGWVVVAGMALQRHRRRRGYQTPLFTRITGLKIADAGLGLPLCWLLGYLHFLFARRAPIRAEYQGREASEILMLRPGGMGDMLLMVPVIRKLRAEFPRARIDIICESRNLDVLRIAGLADCALPYDTQPLRLCWHLIRRRYDIAIDSEQFHHFSAIMAFFSRAPIRIGYKINPARNQLYTHLVGYDMDGFEGRQFARLLKPLNISDWNYSLEGVLADTVLPLPSLEKAKDLQAAIAAGPFVAVHAGSRSPYKTWGTGKFIALIQGLGQRQTVGIVLVGAASESASSAAIVPYIDRQQIRIGNGVGRFTLAETAAIIRRARLFIGGDSGLGHLAVALGTPTVLIFGPSDSHKWGHSGTRHKVVQRPLACAPCFIFGYHRPCRTFQCLAEITPEAVLAACDELLRSTA